MVNTTAFHPRQSNPVIPSSPQLQIYERFTPLADGRLLYTYTVFDPALYSEPFTLEMSLQRLATSQRPVPRHCHEHNLNLPAELISARQSEARTVLSEGADAAASGME